MDLGEDQVGPQADAGNAKAGGANGVASLIQNASPSTPQPVHAHTYVRHWTTSSKPVALKCDDGEVYIVKARQSARPKMARVMVNDHIVARLGDLLEAPTADVAFVHVPAELIAAQAEMQHMEPGVAHGSKEIKNVTERASINHVHLPENRERFARIAVLYGWVGASDHQLVYQKTAPKLVYSVDHGHFFPNGPAWTMMSLDTAPVAKLDSTISQACSFTQKEIESAIQALAQIDKEAIAEAVAGPPDHWGLTGDERVALANFLVRRRDELLAAYPPGQQDGGKP